MALITSLQHQDQGKGKASVTKDSGIAALMSHLAVKATARHWSSRVVRRQSEASITLVSRPILTHSVKLRGFVEGRHKNLQALERRIARRRIARVAANV